MASLRGLGAQARELAIDLADVALSRSCVWCQREGTVICDRCRGRLPTVPLFRDHEPPIWYAAEHDDLVRELVLAHKERGVRALTPVLGELLAQAAWPVIAQEGQPYALVPIPPHRRSVRERGRDSLHEIARCAARRLRHQGQQCTVASMLTWRHEGERHAGSSARSRWELSDAFDVASRGKRKLPVVVVDDVVTTGSTVMQAVHALRAADIDVLAIACIGSRSLRSR